MEVYIVMILVSVCFAYLAEKSQKQTIGSSCRSEYKIGKLVLQKSSIYKFMAIIPMALVGGFRYYVGTDYTTYLKKNGYIGAIFHGKDTDVEWLFKLLIKIAYSFKNKQLVFFVVACLFSFFIMQFIYNLSDDWAFSVILILLTGTFSFSLNIMRQMLAVSICMYALKYALQKKVIPYIALILIAAAFHSLALIFLPFYFLIDVKFNNKKIILLLLGILYLISGYMSKVVYKVLLLTGSKYAHYFVSTIRGAGQSSRCLILFNFLLIAFCIIFDKKDDILGNVFFKYEFLAVLPLVLALPNSNRLSYLFVPIQIVLIPHIISQIDNIKIKNIVKYGILLAYSAFFMYYLYHLNINETFPFKWIFKL